MFRELNTIEKMLVKAFTDYGDFKVEISKEDGCYYIGVDERFVFNDACKFMEYVTDTLSMWNAEKENADIMADRFNSDTYNYLESVQDYFSLFCLLDADTTVLPIAQGGVFAPTTIGAYLHHAEGGADFLAVYDYEANDMEFKQELEDLFPSVQDSPIPYKIECFSSGGGCYHAIMHTESNTYYAIDHDAKCLSLYAYDDAEGPIFTAEDMLWSIELKGLSADQKAVYSLMRVSLDEYMGRG